MPSATITVKYVNPPKDGGKRGSIKTEDDEFYGVWPENMHAFEPGRTYRIEYSEKDMGGRTLRNVRKVLLSSPSAQKHVDAPNCPSAQAPAADHVGEVAFCATVLTAFIRAGKIGPDPQQLTQVVAMLRRLYALSFKDSQNAPPR